MALFESRAVKCPVALHRVAGLFTFRSTIVYRGRCRESAVGLTTWPT